MSLVHAPEERRASDDAPRPVTVAVADAPPASPAARASAVVAIVAMVVAFVTAPGSRSELAAGDFAEVTAGLVEVRAGDGWDTVPVGATVADGDTVRTQDEYAELRVRDGALSLSRWTEASVDGDHLVLDRGGVLFEAERSYAVDVAGLRAAGRGTWRVDATGVTRVATYQGGVAVTGPRGATAPLSPLQQLPVLSGGVDVDVEPLRYLAADPWDARLLADALAVDRLLERTAVGLRGRYGTALQEPDFYADFTRFEDLLGELPSLAETSDAGRLGPPASTLVALVVADLLVTKARLAPPEAAARIDELRQAGATWGLIVVAHDLTAADLDATIDRSLRQRGSAVDEGTAAPLRRSTPTGPGATTSPTPGPSQSPSGDGGGDGGPEPSPSPSPSEPPDDPGTLDPAEDAVEDLGSLLDPIVPGSGETADDASDAIDSVDDLLPDPPGVAELVPSALAPVRSPSDALGRAP